MREQVPQQEPEPEQAFSEEEARFVLERFEGQRKVYLSERNIFLLTGLSILIYIFLSAWAITDLVSYHSGQTEEVGLVVEKWWEERRQDDTTRSTREVRVFQVRYEAFGASHVTEISDLERGSELYDAVYHDGRVLVMRTAGESVRMARDVIEVHYLLLAVLPFFQCFVTGIAGNRHGRGSGILWTVTFVYMLTCGGVLGRLAFVDDWQASPANWFFYVPMLIVIGGSCAAATVYAILFLRAAKSD